MLSLNEQVRGTVLAFIMEWVHILPEKCDFLEAFISQISHLILNGANRPTSLSAAGKWNDAECAHIVAAAHDRDPGMQLVLVFPHRNDICVSLIEG